MKLEPIQPRQLRHRTHYKFYAISFLVFSSLIFSFWLINIPSPGLWNLWMEERWVLLGIIGFYVLFFAVYFIWLKPKLTKSIQVYPKHLVIQNGSFKDIISFDEIESVNRVCWSIFYVKMKSGIKHYFNSSYERIDYIWEGIYQANPEIMTDREFEDFRLKLVQYDHHQKRKEWFFKHRMIDILTWGVLPLLFLIFSFLIQSKYVIIHQEGIYLFRLFMYSLLVLLITSFIYSIALKKFIFDRKISFSLLQDSKIRDLEFEGMILQKSKLLQLMTSCILLIMLIKSDLNLFSISKIREDIADFNLKKGHTVLVDNRFNCISCKYPVKDGDYIVFGKGLVGQVMAREGDMVGEVRKDHHGRMLASENVHEVPRGHIAVKASNGKDILFVKIEELIGKIQN